MTYVWILLRSYCNMTPQGIGNTLSIAYCVVYTCSHSVCVEYEWVGARVSVCVKDIEIH